jgi:hypothetical protein
MHWADAKQDEADCEWQIIFHSVLLNVYIKNKFPAFPR